VLSVYVVSRNLIVTPHWSLAIGHSFYVRAYDKAIITSNDEDWKTYNDILNNYVKMLKISIASETKNEQLEAGTDSNLTIFS
jgi:7-cyano-7-deazaguanine synthase in queuosine biosynthesis